MFDFSAKGWNRSSKIFCASRNCWASSVTTNIEIFACYIEKSALPSVQNPACFVLHHRCDFVVVFKQTTHQRMETFDGIKFTVTGSADPVPESEVVAAEDSLNCRFPSDYRRFVMKYGAGFFLKLPIVIFSPRKIADSTEADQQRLRDHWFWDESAEVLSQKDGVRTIACFDTDIGHDIRFLPENASIMFVFSHDDDTITPCGSFKEIVRLLDPDCESQVYEFRVQKAA